MRVLHVIPSLSPTQGGPSVALPLIARALVQAGVNVEVATTDDDGPKVRLDVPLGQRLDRDGYAVRYFRKQTEFYKVSLGFRRWARWHACEYDLVHIHALFSHTSIAAAHAARRARVPYLVRPLGVLNRWGMQNRRRILKSLSFRFVDQPVLRHAAAIHYTARAEQIEAAQAGATAPSAVVPLGIDVRRFQNLQEPERFWMKFPQTRGRDVVLFLSRVDAKKGLDLLLPAFAKVWSKFPQALLVIAGTGETCVRNLRARAAQLGIADAIVWTGFLDGVDKLAGFAAATLFVLPSHSENFGIALVEALAAGLPCITTTGVAVSEDIRSCDAGLVVPCEVPALAAELERALGDSALRARLGANARQLAQERFSIETMGQALRSLYQRILVDKQRA